MKGDGRRKGLKGGKSRGGTSFRRGEGRTLASVCRRIAFHLWISVCEEGRKIRKCMMASIASEYEIV